MKNPAAPVIGVILLAALAAVALPGQKAPGPAGNKEALAVLNRMIEALGGRKALGAIKDMTVTGTVEAPEIGLTSPFVLYQKEPDRMRMDITVAEAATTITQAFDGRTGWGTDARTMRPEEMPEGESRDVSHKALGNAALLDPRSLGVTYALKPKQTLGDRDYIVLEQTLADGHKSTYFLDPETHLPARLSTRTLDPAGAEADAETVFSDYREFCGARIACSSRTLRGGKEVQRLTVAGVTCNTGLDDSLFELKTR
jgi:outer membrane lipoprotein-sorting protein